MDRNREFDILSRDILRCAHRGESRSDFLRRASESILLLTGAEDLSFWLEHDDLKYCWWTQAHPLVHRFSPLPEEIPPSGSGPPGLVLTPHERLLRRVVPLFEAPEELPGVSSIGAGEVVWHAHRALLSFEIDAANAGLLELRRSPEEPFQSEQICSLEGMTLMLGTAIANRRAQVALRERVKELTCVYRISQIASQPSLSLGEKIQEIVEQLPPAWQIPERTSARVVFSGGRYSSRDFRSGSHCLYAPILVRGERSGRVEVFLERTPENGTEVLGLEEDPFLEEESNLIQGVAGKLGLLLERKLDEEEREHLQEQVRHADRLATIGQLAAGVAHELNEPLGNILGFAQLLAKNPHLDQQGNGDVRRVVNASLYAREIIRKLMFFSRQTPSKILDVNLNKVVEEGLSLLELRLLRKGVDLSVELSPEVPWVAGDPSQLQQVVVNLVVNAIQAMPEGGELRLETRHMQNETCLVVQDSGVGIAPADLDQIFLPFFTRRELGEGTGLGLSVIHGIVTAHGGTVEVESKVGLGTKFFVRLPIRANKTSESLENDE